MATNSASNTSELPRRIPKLAVRNRVPEDELPPEPLIEHRHPAYRTPQGSSEYERPTTSDIPTSSSFEGVRELDGNQTELRRQSPTQDVEAEASESKTKGQQAKKKKNAGMLGFLTLKEPSTKALEDFAAAEKERTKNKGVHTTAFGSSQKLPDYVPKVNSKWDGMPASAKRRSADLKEGSKSKRNVTALDSTAQFQGEGAFTTRDGSSEECGRPDSKQLDIPNASKHKNSLLPPSSSQTAPTFSQLTPLPEESPHHSAVSSGQNGTSQSKDVGKEPHGVANAVEKSPPTFSGEGYYQQPAQVEVETSEPGSGTDSNAPSSQRKSEETMDIPAFPEPKTRSKAINFSRPLPRSVRSAEQNPAKPQIAAVQETS